MLSKFALIKVVLDKFAEWAITKCTIVGFAPT
jgi:hypothetical protein